MIFSDRGGFFSEVKRFFSNQRPIAPFLQTKAKFQGTKLQKSRGAFQKNGAKLNQHLYFLAKCLGRQQKTSLARQQTQVLTKFRYCRAGRNRVVSRGRKIPNLHVQVGEDRI